MVNLPKKPAANAQVIPKRAKAKKAEPMYRSDALAAAHSAAVGLFKAGGMDQRTMRQFDTACLVAPQLNATDVKRIRTKENVSQEVLARYMGINKSTVQKWESASNIPNPMAQRLLKVIDEHGLDIIS